MRQITFNRFLALVIFVQVSCLQSICTADVFAILPTSGSTPVRLDTTNFDGNVVAGHEWLNNSWIPFYWRPDGSGKTHFSGLGPTGYAIPNGISHDGTTIVGRSYNGQNYEGFHWTSGTGSLGLNPLPGDIESTAYGISGNGSTVVGVSGNGAQTTAVRWNQSGNVESLGVRPGGSLSLAYAVSVDGSTIVGSADDSSGKTAAARWTEADGWVSLGYLNQTVSDHSARAVSDDGSVIVGTTGGRAFAWTENTGMIQIEHPDGEPESYTYATDISADGSLVVGFRGVFTTHEDAAFVWSQESGTVDLMEYFNQNGLDTSQWEAFPQVHAISGDGKTFIGTGVTINGEYVGFVAYVNSIPEPSTTAICAILFAGILSRRCRRAR